MTRTAQQQEALAAWKNQNSKGKPAKTGHVTEPEAGRLSREDRAARSVWVQPPAHPDAREAREAAERALAPVLARFPGSLTYHLHSDA